MHVVPLSITLTLQQYVEVSFSSSLWLQHARSLLLQFSWQFRHLLSHMLWTAPPSHHTWSDVEDNMQYVLCTYMIYMYIILTPLAENFFMLNAPSVVYIILQRVITTLWALSLDIAKTQHVHTVCIYTCTCTCTVCFQKKVLPYYPSLVPYYPIVSWNVLYMYAHVIHASACIYINWWLLLQHPLIEQYQMSQSHKFQDRLSMYTYMKK